MARVQNPITIYRGDSYPIVLTIRDSATSLPLDLTSCSLLLTVDTLENPPDATTKVFQVAGVLDADPTTGVAVFTPTTVHTATVGDYYYDVQLTDADGNVRTIVKSTFTVTMDITK